MKPRGKPIYSINEGNACLFDDAVTKYLESIKFPKVSRLEFIPYFVVDGLSFFHLNPSNHFHMPLAPRSSLDHFFSWFSFVSHTMD